ncbi:MAG: hypothetical protein LBJ73_05365 [Rickettsiales bacterium]|jgi:hypothetical protein|nr:hypothetical protein [Rickettsiales bacterium]
MPIEHLEKTRGNPNPDSTRYSKKTLQAATAEYPIRIQKSTNLKNGCVIFSASFVKNGKKIRLFRSYSAIDTVARIGKSFVILRKKNAAEKPSLILVNISNGDVPFRNGAARIDYDFNLNRLYVAPFDIIAREIKSYVSVLDLSGKKEIVKTSPDSRPEKLKTWCADQKLAAAIENSVAPIAPVGAEIVAEVRSEKDSEKSAAVALGAEIMAIFEKDFSELLTQIAQAASPFMEKIIDAIADRVAAKIAIPANNNAAVLEPSATNETPQTEKIPPQQKQRRESKFYVADLSRLSIKQLRAKLYIMRHKVFNFHLHNTNKCSDLHNPFWIGGVDFKKFLGEVKKMNYDFPVTIEMNPVKALGPKTLPKSLQNVKGWAENVNNGNIEKALKATIKMFKKYSA